MSESLFTVCEFPIDREYDICPVGKPNFPDIGLTVLDDDDKPAAVGDMGEICFENPYFRGYLGLPEETAEVMRGGLYHTGDIGYFDEQGRLVISGRKNDMIKINGNRVEPSEIERNCVSGGTYDADKKYFDDLFGGKEWCTGLIPDLSDKGYLMQIATFPVQVTIDDAVRFEKTSGLSRTALFTVAMLLSLAKMNHSDNCMVTFSFHNRTNTTRMNAVGLLVGTLSLCTQKAFIRKISSTDSANYSPVL